MADLIRPLALTGAHRAILRARQVGAAWTATHNEPILDVEWQVEITFKGPDSRYEPAVATLDEDEVSSLIESLKAAMAAASEVGAVPIGSTYVSEIEGGIGNAGNLSLAVVCTSDTAGIRVSIGNTRWVFSQQLGLPDAQGWLDEIEGVERNVEQMVANLKQRPSRVPLPRAAVKHEYRGTGAVCEECHRWRPDHLG